MRARLQRFLDRAALGRPELRAWAMYDWANSAFWLTVITAVFPTYYRQLVGDALDDPTAQYEYASTTRNALIAIAVAALPLGAMADLRAVKKLLLAVFAGIGIAATAAMFFLLPGDWELGLLLFAIANFGVAGSVIFYDALLPHVARPSEVDKLSTSGFALGYVGSGLLLIANLAWIKRPDLFGLPSGEGLSVEEETLPIRLAFLSVAIWWGVFTLPLLFRVREPEVADRGKGPLIADAMRRTKGTLLELWRFPAAFRMLMAFLIYNDGITTLIRMSTLYAISRELDETVVIASILVLQFVGVPFALLFGHLGGRFGPKRMVQAGLFGYIVICCGAYFMVENWHFVALALSVGMVQGGTQGLSRSLFASLIPNHKSGEMFALFAVFEKFAGMLGPTLFALMILWTGDEQNAVLSLIAFFVIGAFVLRTVDVERGREQARAAERAYERLKAMA